MTLLDPEHVAALMSPGIDADDLVLVIEREEDWLANDPVDGIGPLVGERTDVLWVAPGDARPLLLTRPTAAVTVVAGLASLVEGWGPVGRRELAMLVASSVFMAGGYVSMVSAMRHGEFSVISPFRYTGVVYALVLGFLVWGDVPNALTWTGIGLLVGSGMYVLHRESVRAREAQRSRESAPISKETASVSTSRHWNFAHPVSRR